IVDGVEDEAVVALQRRVLATDTIHTADEFLETRGTIPVPGAQLVLLRVEIFFAALLTGAILHELVRGAVNAITRPQRSGQHQPRHESRPAAELQIFGQDVGWVGPEIGT